MADKAATGMAKKLAADPKEVAKYDQALLLIASVTHCALGLITNKH